MTGLVLRSIITAFGLSVIIMTLLAGVAQADPVVSGEEHCVVNVRGIDRLNIRAHPSARAQTVARKRYADCGMIVQAECRGNWCPVEDGHNLGWVHRHYISMVSPAMYCVSGVARGDGLNLRAYPSPRSSVITQLHRQQCNISFLPFAVGDWQKIRVGGWQGWVNRRYLSGQ